MASESWHDIGVAPDMPGTMDAWRAWRVVRRDGRYLLGSVMKPTLWPAGEALQARCVRVRPLAWLRPGKDEHRAPHASCRCGIYGAGLELAAEYLAEMAAPFALARVLGQVAFWGSIVECERGFRAANAYPIRIYVPTDAFAHDGRRAEIVRGLSRYGVPVEPLPVRCAEAARVLARRETIAPAGGHKTAR